ncbi:MAG: single-stranded-DNA-specific exonuclease RecJ [Cyanobacteria bacterium P01_A01_bin.135]
MPDSRANLGQWQVPQSADLPAGFIEQVSAHLPPASRRYASMVAQLLWRRGIGPGQVSPFLDLTQYTPTSPFAFGEAMTQACHRLAQARDRRERVALWGDFDADGITATAVLWEGLKAVFPSEQLTYVIPNRLTQSHGLNREGIGTLAEAGYSLIVTCDTGSTHTVEICYAKTLGLDIVVTDHHTLPTAGQPEGEPVALINPRSLPADHPLAHLSGVAVAYKLIEALYEHLELPDQPEALLDLVAIGLIADLVELRGDCRYLAQRGLIQLQKQQRPGLKHLIKQCRRSGDRPADISYGLGPRINAVSRIHGDASFCVELLTTLDEKRAAYLAQQAELANQRRRSLQQRMLLEVEARLSDLDDTTGMIVLSSPQWSVGILGLVAGQVAHRYGRPTLLLQTPVIDSQAEGAAGMGLARGSARSVGGLDLYTVVQQHAHLLHQFGGHPYALGLTLPPENIPLLRAALNRQVRVTPVERPAPTADGLVTVQDMGHDLFQALKPLEPFGMGHPIPRLLLTDVWFSQVRSSRQTDLQGKHIDYPHLTCQICDQSCPDGRPAIWWGHRKPDLPEGCCHAVVELDFDSTRKDYRQRIISVAPANADANQGHQPVASTPGVASGEVPIRPAANAPETVWQQLVGVAKYLCRTEEAVEIDKLAERLSLSRPVLNLGLETLTKIGIAVEQPQPDWLQMRQAKQKAPLSDQQAALYRFLMSAWEVQFQHGYGREASRLNNAAHGQALDDVIEVP